MNIIRVTRTKRTLQTVTGIFVLTLIWGAAKVQAQCSGPMPVTFPPGLNSSVIKGTIPASKAICYELRARKGQTMKVQLDSPANGVLFNVIAEGYDVEPLAMDKKSWESVLDETGNYTISVHAARAGAVFTLDISVSGARPGTTSHTTTTTSACGNFSGVYVTDYGPLRLTRTGDQVRGSYSSSYTEEGAQDSTLSGTVRGNVLTGRWNQPDGKGGFRFTLNSGGRSFKGSFGISGPSNDSGEWNGHCR